VSPSIKRTRLRFFLKRKVANKGEKVEPRLNKTDEYAMDNFLFSSPPTEMKREFFGDVVALFSCGQRKKRK